MTNSIHESAASVGIEPHVVILAGGSGSRLWPASRTARPKFLLAFDSVETMLERTLVRALALTRPERIHIATLSRYEVDVAHLANRFGVYSLILEPEPRDTAPALTLAVTYIHRIEPNALIVTLPADQAIRDDGTVLCDTIQIAVDLANTGKIVCLGVEPTSSDTDLGYVHAPGYGQAARAAKSFHEKPCKEAAEKYVATEGYYWNSAILIFQAKCYLSHMQNLANQFICDVDASLSHEGYVDSEVWSSIPYATIDHAFLRPLTDSGLLTLLPIELSWEDLGTWHRIADARGRAGNSQIFEFGSEKPFVHGDGNRRYVVYGPEELVIVDCDDVILITDRAHSSRLKQLIEALKQRGWSDLL
ncbi:sugar phosphate nucleotidyltransferase [Nocardia takedensis]